MAQIKPETVLKLERVRQKAVQDLRDKNIYIDENADINEVYENYKSLNNSGQLLDGSIGDVVRDDNITQLRGWALASLPNLKKAYFKNVVNCGSFILAYSNALEHIELPNAIDVGSFTGQQTGNYDNIKTLYFPKMETGFYQQMFRGTWKLLNKIIIPKANFVFGTIFAWKPSTLLLELLDSSIDSFNVLTGASGFPSIEKLIIRTNVLPTLAATSLFPNPNLKIYIKSDLVNSLKAATNWSALPCMANEDAVVALETSEYADERWFEQTDEFKLNYIYQDLDEEQEDEEETNGGETP